MTGKTAEPATDKRICGTCRHFIGGGDYNLCCDLRFELCYRDTFACGMYEYSPDTEKRLEEQYKQLAEWIRKRRNNDEQGRYDL